MEASEYLIKCLKMSHIHENSTNVKQDFKANSDENKSETSFLNEDPNKALIVKLIENIQKKEEMDKALYELSKQRENFKDIAVYIYYSTGTMSLL